MQALSKAPPAQRRLAEAMFRDVSRPYVQALRLLRGTDLRYARCPPSEEEVQRARVVAATLAPLHRRVLLARVWGLVQERVEGSSFARCGRAGWWEGWSVFSCQGWPCVVVHATFVHEDGGGVPWGISHAEAGA